MVFLWFSYGFCHYQRVTSPSYPQKTTAWSESSGLATLWTSESQSLKHMAILTKNHHYINPIRIVTFFLHTCMYMYMYIYIYGWHF